MHCTEDKIVVKWMKNREDKENLVKSAPKLGVEPTSQSPDPTTAFWATLTPINTNEYRQK